MLCKTNVSEIQLYLSNGIPSIIKNGHRMCFIKAVPKDFATFIREQPNVRAYF